MSTPFVRDLEVLAELFQSGAWREIRIETGDFSVLLSTDPSAGGLLTIGDASDPVAATAIADPEETKAVPAPVASQIGETANANWHAVTAPNLGTFYRSPKPGSSPFVELGQRVTADSEICLIEVMKLFTSVKAGVAGRVRRIDATDAELVEGGQTLFHIEPE